MSNEIKALPIEWPITIVRGDKQRPIVGTVKDVNEVDITGFTWALEISTNQFRDIAYTWDGSSDGATFILDLTNTYPAAQYQHRLKIIKNGWQFHVIAGAFWNSRPGEVTGGTVGFGDFTITLPVEFDPIGDTIEFSTDFSSVDFKLN